MSSLHPEVRLAIVEDDAAFRDEVVRRLSQHPGWKVVAACPSAEAALREIPPTRPNLVLIDIRLPKRAGRPDRSGLALVPQLKSQIPDARLVVLSVVDDTEDIFQALQDGAFGYIQKGESLSELVTEIGIALSGGTFMSPSIARKCAEWIRTNKPLDPSAGHGLTTREWEILRLRSRGWSQERIAADLGISPHTVRNHFAKIFEKLGVSDVASAIFQVAPALRARESLRKQSKTKGESA